VTGFSTPPVNREARMSKFSAAETYTRRERHLEVRENGSQTLFSSANK
jgi:hypothetical protein